MDEKNGKKVVSGIAIRRRSLRREREILLVKEKGKWELPKVRVRECIEGLEELELYMSETLGVGRIGINNFYGEVRDRRGDEKTIEAYLVTVYTGKEELINGKNNVRWFSKGEIKYPDVSRITSRIIRYLKRDHYF